MERDCRYKVAHHQAFTNLIENPTPVIGFEAFSAKHGNPGKNSPGRQKALFTVEGKCKLPSRGTDHVQGRLAGHVTSKDPSTIYSHGVSLAFRDDSYVYRVYGSYFGFTGGDVSLPRVVVGMRLEGTPVDSDRAVAQRVLWGAHLCCDRQWAANDLTTAGSCVMLDIDTTIRLPGRFGSIPTRVPPGGGSASNKTNITELVCAVQWVTPGYVSDIASAFAITGDGWLAFERVTGGDPEVIRREY